MGLSKKLTFGHALAVNFRKRVQDA